MSYTREQLYEALRKADAAGDTQAATALTAQIKSMDAPAVEQPPAEEEGLTGGVTYEGPMQYITDSAQNIGAGLVQGALGVAEFPLEAASELGRGIRYGIREGGGGLLDMLGAEGAADWWRGAPEERNPMLDNMPSDQIERLSPTPRGLEGQRFASQLVGGMAVPFGPKPTAQPASVVQQPAKQPNSLRELVEAGNDNNVRVMTSDVRPPQTFMSRFAQNVGERIPIAGTAGPRAAQQDERVAAVKKVAEDFGVEVGENYFEDVASDLAKTRGARISRLANQKDAVIDGVQGPVQTPRAVQAIDQQIARLEGTGNRAVQPVVNELKAFRETLSGGLSLRNVEENRKILGKAFEGDSMASIKDIGQKATNAIYGPLRDDMAAHIRATAGDGAVNTWKKANEELAAMAGELSVGTFRRVLADAEATPENVSRLLFSQKPSDVRRLMGNISPEGRAKAQAAIIERALSKAGDDVSPDKFANEIGRLGKQIGVVFEGQDLARIQGLERVLQATKRAAQASVVPPTGVQNTPIVGGYAAGTVLGSAAIPYAAVAGLAARAYESAAMRNLLLGISKTKPGSKAESQMLQRIEKIIASQTSLNNPANDRVGVALAASETEEQ